MINSYLYFSEDYNFIDVINFLIVPHIHFQLFHRRNYSCEYRKDYFILFSSNTQPSFIKFVNIYIPHQIYQKRNILKNLLRLTRK